MTDQEFFGSYIILNDNVKYIGNFNSSEEKADFELWTECCEKLTRMICEIANENPQNKIEEPPK